MGFNCAMQSANAIGNRTFTESCATVINLYKTTDSLQTLRDAGVTIVCDYDDKNGIFVLEIVVKTSDLE